MENRISQRVRDQLSRIIAPVEVAVPPMNAVRELMMLPSGQIRHYGYAGTEHAARRNYIASDDFGLSWQEYDTPSGAPGAVVQSPWSGDFLTVFGTHELPVEAGTSILTGLPKGLFCARSTTGVDGEYAVQQVADAPFWIPRQPMPLHSRRRWIVACQMRSPEQIGHPAVLRSDDDGRSWQKVVLPPGPRHEVACPHKGVRWQNYFCEPTIVELSSGRLWMLIRTSTDMHYESFSDDAGETWTDPRPSRFYGTITMPTLFRLRDGRIIHFWCNTTPLPELDHDQQSELLDWEREGYGEDFFTNRDAFHAAISDDDGKTWRGFREVRLSPIRNEADYRTVGGHIDDKSMHQSQALELPTGHVLVSHGQHPACRRIVIFDPAWLYETQRSEEFCSGLGNVSSFQYVKSIAGNFRAFGHCAYNRRPGPLLVPSPDGEPREVLHLFVQPDPHLVHATQGLVWNFPAGHSGELRVNLRLAAGSRGVRVSLMDRWINPVDPVADLYAIHRVNADASNCVPDVWHELVFRWTDSTRSTATCSIGDKTISLELKTPSLNGISYVHIQTLAADQDLAGTYVRGLAFHHDSRRTEHSADAPGRINSKERLAP